MHPDPESNLITLYSESLGSTTQPEMTSLLPLLETPKEFHSFEHNSCLSVRLFYSLYCVFIIDADF